MAKWLGVVFVLAVSVNAMLSIASGEGKDGDPTKPASVVVWTAASPVAFGAQASAVSGNRELTIRQRRELGLTIPNMLSAIRELRDAGEIDSTTNRAEMAALVAARLEQRNPEAFGAVGLNWEAILAFIEALLPILLKLLGV